MQIQSFNQPWPAATRSAVAEAAAEPAEPDTDGEVTEPVDESRFQLSDPAQTGFGSYEDPQNPGHFITLNTPEEAWQQALTGQVNSLVSVEAALAVGYQMVSGDLSSQLAEQGVTAAAGTRVSYGVLEEGGEPQFWVENSQNPDNAAAISQLLNNAEDDGFRTGFLKLEQLARGSSIFHVQSRDLTLQGQNSSSAASPDGTQQTRYDYDFGLRFNGNDWLLDGRVERLTSDNGPVVA